MEIMRSFYKILPAAATIQINLCKCSIHCFDFMFFRIDSQCCMHILQRVKLCCVIFFHLHFHSKVDNIPATIYRLSCSPDALLMQVFVLMCIQWLQKGKWTLWSMWSTCNIYHWGAEDQVSGSRNTLLFESPSWGRPRQQMLAAHFRTYLFDVRHRVRNVSELYLFNMGNQWQCDYVL